MFTAAKHSNTLRSLGGMIASAVLTVTVFYGAAGPDPRADIYMVDVTQTAASHIA
ncbi:hypothetical protein KCG44_05525 [Pacificimonas sp. WHA3]|uniref:Uncharacterized protein n=1 Tax=Pacificimonas pallii TaxID=2827236 RepID=A0ABS6SCU8_9SPHN|nr:hypothetical protein [Pacificimonas pallii]MBV7256242.1 hypothetical protein [Pacificimonas pallii]